MSPFSQLQLLKIHTKTSTNFTCRKTCAAVELKKRLSRFLNFTPARYDGTINVSVEFIASNTSICRIYNWNSIYESNLNKIQLSMSIISPKSGAFWWWAPINFPATVRGKSSSGQQNRMIFLCWPLWYQTSKGLSTMTEDPPPGMGILPVTSTLQRGFGFLKRKNQIPKSILYTQHFCNYTFRCENKSILPFCCESLPSWSSNNFALRTWRFARFLAQW